MSSKTIPNLFSPSEEQQKIIDALKNKQNVIVNAVAGSGKTTTILGIAKQMPDIKILQITYNKALKLEVEEKIKQQKLKNIKIYTYHGLCCGCYDHEARSDDKIIEILKNDNKLKPRKTPIQYSIVVIDEAQDMCNIYFKLVYKFLKDINYKVNLLILGDNLQGIYEFKGADSRYLTLADKIFISHNPFVKLTLNTSYRLTQTIARFINEVMMDKRISINAPKIGDPIKYFKINTNDANEIGDIAKIVINLIKDGEALADDFFILAPSIKNMKPLKYLENYLVRNNIQCFVPISEDTQLKDKIIKNKIVFTTFHQSKGRERPYCIIIGFDNSYFSYYDKESDFNVCPNTLYVAASRASKQLILIEDIYNNTCSFIKMPYLVDGGIGVNKDGGVNISNSDKLDDKIEENISLNDIETFVKISKITVDKNIKQKTQSEYKELILSNISEKEHKTIVTDLIKFINETILSKISILVDKLYKIHKPVIIDNIVVFPADIKTSSSTFEEVSDINGLAIPAMLDNPDSNQNAIYKAVNDFVVKLNKSSFGKLHPLVEAFKKVVYPCMEIKDWLYLSNLYIALRSEYYYKINQIKDYNWLNEDIVKNCHKNITNNINIRKNIIFERPIGITYKHSTYGIMKICGCIDIDDKNNIWELKCVDELTIEHKLQLIVYCWLCRQNNIQFDDGYCIGTRNCFLLNIKTGEVLELISKNDSYLEYINEIDNLDQIMNLLFDNKYLNKKQMNDNDFIKNNINEINIYLDVIDNFQLSNVNNINDEDNITIEYSEYSEYSGYSGYSSNSDSNSFNEINEINDFNFEDNINISNNYYSSDEDNSSDIIDYTKLKVNEIINLCNKEFTDDNKIKNLKKKKKQELIDILLNLIKNKKENDKIELDF